MINLQTLSLFLDKRLCFHGDTFMIHACENGELVIIGIDGMYMANIGAMNDAGISWFRFMLGARVAGVIKFSEITVV